MSGVLLMYRTPWAWQVRSELQDCGFDREPAGDGRYNVLLGSDILHN